MSLAFNVLYVPSTVSYTLHTHTHTHTHIYIYISLFMAALGLGCCSGFSPVVVSRGRSPVAVQGPLIAEASPVAEHRLQGVQLQ